MIGKQITNFSINNIQMQKKDKKIKQLLSQALKKTIFFT
jgi:hypothetical protein